MTDTAIPIRTIVAALLMSAVLTATGCGSTPTSTHTAAPPRTPARPPVNSAAAIRAAHPQTPFTSAFFRPTLRLTLPRGWSGNDLDAHSLPVFPGDDELASYGEITFVSDLSRWSLDKAIRRLHAAPGARPTPIVPERIGHYRALGFDVRSRGTVTFRPIGIHTVRGDQLRVMAFRARGRTIAVFEFVGAGHDAAPFRAAADRVLRTVRLG